MPEDRRAWHAGVSCWAGENNINARSIGIELVNPGHEFGYVRFPKPDRGADHARPCHPDAPSHSPWRVLGHSDVAPARKEDPGELFPGSSSPIRHRAVARRRRSGRIRVRCAARFGYDPERRWKRSITAFQRHFRPSCVNGMADAETTPRSMLSDLLAFMLSNRARAMKTIGMLGGMSWESTADYYQKLNRETQKRLGGVHSAKT